MADRAEPRSALRHSDAYRSIMIDNVLEARSAPAFEVVTVGA
jgi:hypothetical protein